MITTEIQMFHENNEKIKQLGDAYTIIKDAGLPLALAQIEADMKNAIWFKTRLLQSLSPEELQSLGYIMEEGNE